MMQIKSLFHNKGFQRVLILVTLALVLYVLKSMFNLILFTFIFTYLMDRLQKIISKRFDHFLPINHRLIIVLLYLIFVGGITIALYKYLPVITIQVSQLISQMTDNEFVKYLLSKIGHVQISKYINQGVDIIYNSLANIGKVSLQILLSLILSLFFLLEKKRIVSFTSKFKESKLTFFYEEIGYFGKKFIRSFGKVIEVQFLIAIVNCILSVIALWILGFPQLLGLAIMIFLLGLIPVAGMIISLFPLSIIAYNVGGLVYVLYILIVIIVIHSIESYVLNPKFMSAKTNLPIFYTFIVLVFSEHFLGVWGLIIGIPIFMFLLDILEVTSDDEEEKG